MQHVELEILRLRAPLIQLRELGSQRRDQEQKQELEAVTQHKEALERESRQEPSQRLVDEINRVDTHEEQSHREMQAKLSGEIAIFLIAGTILGIVIILTHLKRRIMPAEEEENNT